MFSIAYSRFDRDPGDVNISDVPISFNIGLNDYVEVFFKTNGHRTVHVDSPRNLSSFYLPNLDTTFGGTLPAIIRAPSRPHVGTLAGTTPLRPTGNRPPVLSPLVASTPQTDRAGAGG